MLSHLKRARSGLVINIDNSIRDCWELISINNLQMLGRASVIVVCILGCYAGFSWVVGSPPATKLAYAANLAMHGAFCIYIHRHAQRLRWRTRIIQVLCVLFMMSLMVLEVFMATYGRPEDPAIFFAPMTIVISVIFILPFRLTVTILTVASGLFVVLSSQLKTYHYFMLDTAMAVVALALSLILDYEMLDLRLRDFRLQDELMRLSCTDSLTGLMNKTTVETAAREYFARYGATEASALFVIDLDQFKQINDDRGHLAGDEALEVVGESLMKLFRAQDIVGRVGGDEFVALMKNTRDRSLVARRAALICETVQLTRLQDTPLVLTCSIGVAMCPLHGNTYDTLFAKADEQLYQIKRNGKNGYMLAK